MSERNHKPVRERPGRPALGLTLVVWMAVAVQQACAESAASCVREGNALYHQGKYNEAIEAYDRALVEKAEASEAIFNKANCYYRLDDWARAAELYRQVASQSKDMELVAKARYNLGNCCFKQGLRQRDSDLQKALDALKESIVHWRGVLELRPSNEKAGKNIEVARLIIKDILDQLNKQMQQQQQQAQRQKQIQQKLQELLQRQKAAAQQTQQTKSQAEEGQISQEEASKQYSQQADEQRRLAEETQQLSKQLDANEPNSSPQMQQASEQLRAAASAQQRAEKHLEASDANSAARSQAEAIERLEDAMKQLSGPKQPGQDNQQQQQPQTQQQTQPEDANKPGQQQEQVYAADATADEILERERRQKRLRQMRQRGGYQKVEMDW